MEVKGIRTEHDITIDVHPKEIIKVLYTHFKFNFYDYVKDNKIYFDTEEGYHNTWSETHLKSEDSEKVEILKALELIKNALEVKYYEMRY